MRAFRLALWFVRAVLTAPLMLIVWIAAKLVRALARMLGGAA
jgi:hypothetical protein